MKEDLPKNIVASLAILLSTSFLVFYSWTVLKSEHLVRSEELGRSNLRSEESCQHGSVHQSVHKFYNGESRGTHAFWLLDKTWRKFESRTQLPQALQPLENSKSI
ncbi:unnamed protein product [Calypogeia fissa]